MKFFLLFLIFLPIWVFSQTIDSLNKRIFAYPVNSHIDVDGKLNETVWQNPSIKDFIQRDPNEGKPATEETNVWVAFDQSSIYIAARMNDSSPDSISGLLTRRDYFIESDWFRIYLDPYFDKRTGYYFGVNAGGSIIDGILYNDSWDDDSWNGIWEYGVNRDDKGWSVEVKIPYTQIRFAESDLMRWGINFSRIVQRKNEVSYYVMTPKTESGFVSRFATLEGLNGIKPRQRFEILPYVRTKVSFLLHEADDPFYKSKQFSEEAGADLKVGLGSNLTLDATINPDFGQVEVDPAVVNLSTFETYYQEKRPFFIEGNNIFLFGFGGSNSNWGFNWGTPELFYSRRIGRAPQGSVDDDGYVDLPNETRILGAAKVTGKFPGDWSIGFIDAVTQSTNAKVYNDGDVLSREVEPLTNFAIGRVLKEFSSGKYGLGVAGTSVFRNLKTESLNSNLANRAITWGTDGWITLDSSGTYVINGFFSGSHVEGSEDYITKVQRSSLRYFQRPDAVKYRIDSSRTSLSGFAARLALNKQKGNFYINTSVGTVSPGYEINDAGFQFRGDVINTHLVTGYRWYEPDGIFRRKEVLVAHFRNYNYDGDITEIGYMSFLYFDFENYYGLQLQLGYNPESFSPRNTRGGPLTVVPSYKHIQFSAHSDSRKKVVVYANSQYVKDQLGSEYINISAELGWKPNSTINVSFGPFYEINDEHFQWVTNVEDPLSPTYGSRYVFSFLDQRTVGGNLRVNWTFTPELSLQLFLQPLFSVGDYMDYKELAEGRTNRTNLYGQGGSTIDFNQENNEYNVDPDGTGPAETFTFDNPDFNFKSLRGNLVLRWEFLPGSVFFLVWTHDKANFADPGDFSFGRDFNNLMHTGSNNVLLAKVSYWIDF